MDRIRLYSAQVPQQVRKVVRTLVTGSEEDVKDILPIELRKIEKNAAESLQLAQAVERKFENMMDLTGELLEVSSAAKGHYQKEQEEMKKKREIALAEKKSVLQEIEDAKGQQDRLTKQVKDAKAEWEKAVDSMPSGWDILGMQVIEGITKTVCNTAEVLLPAIATKGMVMGTPSAAVPNVEVDPSSEQSPTDVQTSAVQTSSKANKLKVFSTKLLEDLETFQNSSDSRSNEGRVAENIQETRPQMGGLLGNNCSSKIKSALDQQGLQRPLKKGLKKGKDGEKKMSYLTFSPDKMEAAAKQPSEGNVAENIQETRLQMERLQDDWSSKEESQLDQEGLQLLLEGINICKHGEKQMGELTFSPDKMEAIAKQASELQSNIMKFCTKVQAKVGGNPIYTKPPRQARNMARSANSASSSAANLAVESARFKIAETRSLLEKQEMLYDKAFSDMKESNRELSKVLQRLAKFSSERIANFDQIRDTLVEGIKALASVRKQWQKLVEFFQKITSIIKVCQNESLTSFVEYAKVGQKRMLATGYTDTDFMRDLIYEQVSQANMTSYVVWSISSTYVEISRKHLMSRLASLGHLIALDPEKDRATITAEKNKLLEGSQEAEKEIKKLVSEANDHFHEKVEKRIKQFEAEMVKVLPPEDPARIKEINDTVVNAIKEVDDGLGAENF